jgi:hypothetical protein
VTLSGAAVALAAGAHDTGKSYSYRATLAVRSEVPKPNAPAGAAGTFSATVTEVGKKSTVRWKLTFHGLSGPAAAAHIHLGKAGVAGPVIVPLCGPCKSGMSGSGTMTHDQGEKLEDGIGYVNVHTAKNKAGEIRGQLKLTSHA